MSDEPSAHAAGPGVERLPGDAVRQRALTRAARALSASPDLETALMRIAAEAAAVLDADVAAVYRASPEHGLTLMTAHGLAPEFAGYELAPGMGLAGRVLAAGEALATGDYQGECELPPGSPFRHVRAAVAAPLAWGGELRGVLSAGFEREREHAPGAEEVALVETFAELAAAACHHAATRAGLMQVARTDGLTGCLNHTALHEHVRREIERSRRGLAAAPSVVVFDVDDFKAVNDRHGRQVGDEILRRVGHTLRTGTRDYDVAARYGGDEFAVVCIEATEAEAVRVARRALTRLGDALADLAASGPGGATAGVAEWEPDVSAAELLNRADRALKHGRQEGGRGDAHAYSELPDWFRPGRFGRTRGQARGTAPPDPPGAAAAWPEDEASAALARLRERARALSAALELGSRLMVLLDERAAADATVQALVGDFGWAAAAVLPPDAAEPLAAAGPLAAQVGDGGEDAALTIPPGDAGGTLAARRDGPVTEDDARLLETVAAQLGAAMQAARLHREALAGD